MESGIVHDDDFAWCERGSKALPDILRKDGGVAIAVEAKGRLQFAPTERGDHAGPACTISGFFSLQPLSAFGPASRQPVAMIDTAFVEIHQ